MIVDRQPARWSAICRREAQKLAAWAHSFRELNGIPHTPGRVLQFPPKAELVALMRTGG